MHSSRGAARLLGSQGAGAALGWKALHDGEGLDGAHWRLGRGSGCRRREKAGKNNGQAAQSSGLRLGLGAGTTHCACPTLCVHA